MFRYKLTGEFLLGIIYRNVNEVATGGIIIEDSKRELHIRGNESFNSERQRNMDTLCLSYIEILLSTRIQKNSILNGLRKKVHWYV